MMERFIWGDTWLMDRESRTFIGQDNCEEVLRILNSHDDLVAALKLARNQWLDSIDGHDLSDYQQEALQQIDAALAKAEGGK